MKTISVLLLVFCLLVPWVAPVQAEEGSSVTAAAPTTTAPVPDFTNPAWKMYLVAGFDPKGMWRKDALVLSFGSDQLKASAIVYARPDYFGAAGVADSSAGIFAIVWRWWVDTRRDSSGKPEAMTHSFYARGENGWTLVQRSEIQLNRTKGAKTPIFTLDSPFGQAFAKWVKSFGVSDQRVRGAVPYVVWKPDWAPHQWFDWDISETAPITNPHWQL